MSKRKIHLNFHGNSSGEHLAAWRKDAGLPVRFVLDYYVEIAKIAERGLFDAVFFAAGLALTEGGGRPPRPVLDPVVLLSALSVLTEKIGFVATASTTFNEPYNIARTFSSLDHVSHGRAGWNIVTTYDENASRNFGLGKLPAREDRYGRADEFVSVVKQLWHSWAADAVSTDPAGTVVIDGNKIQPIRHEGRFFSVEGPLQTPRTLQDRPVLFQAGGSEQGRALAARHADAIFSIGLELNDAREFYRDVKARVAAAGRDPDKTHILPGVYVYLGGTEEEAERKREALLGAPSALSSYIDQLAVRLGVTPQDLPLDEPVAEAILRQAEGAAGSIGHTRALVSVLRRDRGTLREFLRKQPVGGPHRVVIGAPEQVAGTLADWFLAKAADGFNVGNMPPADLAVFVEHVIPILQARGLYRHEYRGRTLREHYDLDG